MIGARGETHRYRQVGPHRVRVEPPDVLHIRLNGNVELEHFKGFFELIEREFQPSTRCYVLRDARNGGVVTPTARAYIATGVDNSRVAALVTYGASTESRNVLTMVGKAVRQSNPKALSSGTMFFDTYEDAIAWINEHRAIFH